MDSFTLITHRHTDANKLLTTFDARLEFTTHELCKELEVKCIVISVSGLREFVYTDYAPDSDRM